jgi:hypothetical protein
MRAALGKAARIKSDDPIGFPQPLHHLTDQHLDQRAMVPGCRPDKLLQDQALDINQGRNLLGVFAVQARQEPCQVEVYIALTSLGLQTVPIGHDEIAEAVHQVVKHLRGHDAIVQQLLLT